MVRKYSDKPRCQALTNSSLVATGNSVQCLNPTISEANFFCWQHSDEDGNLREGFHTVSENVSEPSSENSFVVQAFKCPECGLLTELPGR